MKKLPILSYIAIIFPLLIMISFLFFDVKQYTNIYMNLLVVSVFFNLTVQIIGLVKKRKGGTR